MRKLTLIIPWLVLSCAGGTPDGRPRPFEREAIVEKRVLNGPEGVQILLVQTDDLALIETRRIRPELDGIPLLATLGGTTTERTYLVQLNGQKKRLLGRKNRTWTLFLGGPLELDVDETASIDLNPDTLMRRHLTYRAEGKLEALSTFDRQAAESEALTLLQESMSALESPCGFVPEVSIQFDTFADEALMPPARLRNYCNSVRNALRSACDVPELKDYISQNANKYVCKAGFPLDLRIESGVISLNLDLEASNREKELKEKLDAHVFDGQRTFKQSRLQHNTTVCKSPKSSLVVMVGPTEGDSGKQMAYGPPEKMVPLPKYPFLGEGWFFEPRFPNPGHNPNFRGYNLRFFSFLNLDGDKACQLRCGPRLIPLDIVTGAEKQTLLASVQKTPMPDRRQPYALARDKQGVYYYVDQGAYPDTARDFRLYIGRQGQLRRQKMKDIVSDSEGEIFSSARGRLKLYLGKNNAEWQRGKQIRPLTRVEVNDNIDLIFNRLGVYLGQPLYTPCDDL